MRYITTRREMLKAMGYGSAGLFVAGRTADVAAQGGTMTSGGRWLRGNLHMHTYWSDGRAFPEQAISMYKKMGYDFIALSDHNIFAADQNCWKPVVEKPSKTGEVAQVIFDEYKREFGTDVQTRNNNGKTEVRLKTYKEMQHRFNKSNQFLLMPGVEITQNLSYGDRNQVHLNCINLPDTIPFVKNGPFNKSIGEDMDITQVMRTDAAQVAEMSRGMQRPALLMLNHPQWRYWDISPQNLIDTPEIRFFELSNGGTGYGPHSGTESHTLDKFWDVINAFRCRSGAPLIYGTGTDDTHTYFNKAEYLNSRAIKAWIMVRSDNLACDNIITTMAKGDFYTTCGVTLDDVEFNQAKRTLRVKTKTEPDTKYKISFIVTKKNFDAAMHTVECPPSNDAKGHGKRQIPIYSDDIGMTAKVVEGADATYTMAPDDLYVRARIESTQPCYYKRKLYPLTQTAWTQPHIG